MERRRDYKQHRQGNWKFWVLDHEWTTDHWEAISSFMVTAGPITWRRPKTQRIRSAGDTGKDFFLKIYYPSNLVESLKDLFRQSKAFRAFRQGLALRQNGFEVPLTVAAGETRRLRFIRLAFLLTRAVKGDRLAEFLGAQSGMPVDRNRLKTKREVLRKLALEVRRMHQLGFVHGDLIPSNILIEQQGTDIRIISLDHDRTRRYPRWLPQAFWRRNLVQLNRFDLPGISVRDRVRFFRHYLGCQSLGRRERRLAQWLDRKTKVRQGQIQAAKAAKLQKR